MSVTCKGCGKTLAEHYGFLDQILCPNALEGGVGPQRFQYKEFQIAEAVVQCECGGESSGGTHSTWCPAHGG